MKTDLGALWVKQNMELSQKELLETELAYSVLKDKRTKYAHHLLRIINARYKVVKVWREA